MFFAGSRYLSLTRYTVRAKNGATVAVTRLPSPGLPVVLGYYRRSGGDRLDHVAARFLGDATQFWRVCDANGTVSPDTLAARDLIGVPIDAPSGS